MANNLVSIIVPVYKTEKYINKCLDFLLAQTYENIEIIVVNDGSPDNSQKIIDEYANKDSRIKAFIKPNGGSASARNMGLEMAKGDYIMFVDSDDWLDANAVEIAIKGAIETKAEIVRFKICYEFDNGTKKVEENDFEHQFYTDKNDFKKYIYPKMLKGISMNSICRTMYKREITKGLRFCESMETAEDLLFSIEVFTRAKSFLYLALPLYHYYQTNLGMTGSAIKVATKYKCNLLITKSLLKHLPQWDMDNLKNRAITYARILIITVSKLHRIFNK